MASGDRELRRWGCRGVDRGIQLNSTQSGLITKCASSRLYTHTNFPSVRTDKQNGNRKKKDENNVQPLRPLDAPTVGN